MSSIKVSDETFKFINSYARTNKVDAVEAAEKLLSIAQSRVKALANYANKTGSKSKVKKTAKVKAASKTPKAKASTKKTSKVSAKVKKTPKAKAKTGGIPKGFKANHASAPAAPVAATETPAEA